MSVILIQMITHEQLKIDEITSSSQNGNNEWVLLFAVIYVVVFIILLALIYQEELDDLKNMWTDNISQNITYFTITLTGQNNNKIKR